jgi:hypothetical protein
MGQTDRRRIWRYSEELARKETELPEEYLIRWTCIVSAFRAPGAVFLRSAPLGAWRFACVQNAAAPEAYAGLSHLVVPWTCFVLAA